MKQFKSKEEAFEWLENLEELDCCDNFRFAFKDDLEEVNKYNDISDQGCCDWFDEEIIVDGRLAIIGCNYGH